MTTPTLREAAMAALEAFDVAVATELPRVSHVHYDSHEICKHFAGEVRKHFARSALSAPEQAPAIDVDALAQHIRWANGSNKLGAGALAESIVEWLGAPSPASGPGVAFNPDIHNETNFHDPGGVFDQSKRQTTPLSTAAIDQSLGKQDGSKE